MTHWRYHGAVEYWLVLLVALWTCSLLVHAQEAEDTDVVRAKQIAAETVAGVVAEQGAEAAKTETLFIKIIEALRNEFGAEHKLTLRFMAGAGFKLWEYGRYSESRKLYDQLLAIQRRILGAEHPDTLTVQNNLAQLLRAQGDFVGARQHEEEVLGARRRILGG